ncbi:hypothetical protein [Georgenia subflava]|uniref:Uncharacterized protein n=1 Tax=Georgenia subflava TaxID=1622177 RepID=A0A6N7EL35_9MICO|nr:hypothetical protein [Georgenia subflava]MPV37753.1 hypothetical protein [Georgenia subflava]
MSLLLLLALIGLAAIFVVAASRRTAPENTEAATLVAARRHEDVTTAVALTAGILVAGAVVISAAASPGAGPGAPGVLAALGPAAGGLVHLGIHAVGERTWPRPVGAVRTAVLRRRTVRELAGRRAWLLAATSTVLAVVLVLTGATATETGRAVPRLITAEDVAAGMGGGAAGPYPGWPYGLPLLGGTALVLVGAAVAVRMVARRPAVAGTAPEDDAGLRLTSAGRILAGTQLFVGGTLTAVLTVSAVPLGNAGWGLAAGAAAGLAVVAAVASFATLGRALAPARPARPAVTAVR